MEQWADAYLGLQDERVGRWRPIVRKIENPRSAFEKVEGLLVLKGAKWDLYFYHRPNFDHNLMAARLVEHPLIKNCEAEPLKQTGQWKFNSAVG